MKIQQTQSSASTIKIVFLLITVILLVFLGYILYSNYRTSTQETVDSKAENIQPAPAITESKDLEEATTTIDTSELESTNMDDMNEIDKELSTF